MDVGDLGQRIKWLLINANWYTRYPIIFRNPVLLDCYDHFSLGFAYATSLINGRRSDAQFMGVIYPFPETVTNPNFVQKFKGLDLDRPIYGVLTGDEVYTNDPAVLLDEVKTNVRRALMISKGL